MPFATLDGIRHYYRLEGADGRPVLVLSHSIGTDHGMWQPQMADLLRHFQVLRYDTRGHGGSDSSPSEYSIEQFGRDAVGLVDHLGVTRFAWCGLSMGGAIGQWVALNAPNRVTHLVLANTAFRFGDRTMWGKRIKSVQEGGMAAVLDLVLGRFFAEKTRQSANPYVSSIRSVFLGTNPVGYLGCCAALRDFDNEKNLSNIAVPTLIITGDHDVSTPWEGNSEILAREIPDAKVVRLPAAHLSNLEQPRSFTAALLGFLLSDSRNSTERGSEARRRALGDAHVDRAIATTTDFTLDFQDLITRYAWGEIWTRPLIDDRTRRLLVLALMCAAGRWEEFRMHLVAGLNHELEACDLKEILLLVALYAGLPAANTAFHLAQEELERGNWLGPQLRRSHGNVISEG
jgi:3-oxoadipate enol-lactonase/4-carboxymuconolactone decarboxylase